MNEATETTYAVTLKARYESHYTVVADSPEAAYQAARDMDAATCDPLALEFIDYQDMDPYDVVSLEAPDLESATPAL